ncbi:MAG: SRPBCC family protein [Gemmatirosa sp.]|nr:SRPBCC family protein [Gemmatirosa sp.]
MWTTTASAESSAPPAAVWRRYVDVAAWRAWDDGIADSSLDGPFVAGARGRLRPAGGPALAFVLTDVEPERRFADRTPVPHPLVPLAFIELEHRLQPTATGGTRITHTARIGGPLGWLAARVFGPGFVQGLPATVRTLASHAAGEAAAA